MRHGERIVGIEWGGKAIALRTEELADAPVVEVWFAWAAHGQTRPSCRDGRQPRSRTASSTARWKVG